jgi:3-methylcrotonyl-CoA carboxylase alpha subunit
MFAKLLIANRGEIACRVIRTARRMGIATVAVFSDADANALHVAMADEAVRIGPAAPRESYLRGDVILAAALATGAQAIHPGYGFLSENADFAQACAEAGIVFVGPPPAAIRAMGGKSQAKALMAQAGVPLVPGYHGAAQDFDTLQNAAAAIGFPLLVKASAGGGGKGMRIVSEPANLPDAIASCRREAESAFGDGRLLLERYLTCPRHIEIQVFADTHGNILSLFERDCSLQRRHQKVMEEAPAPGLSPATRTAMGAAAVAAARAVGYVGAGTVEFISEDGSFHFMEMNTRLQVEHPVTEAITGLDLVEWQLRVAAGEALPWRQDEVAINGHAIEARLYAEDPMRDFLPSVGTLTHLRLPESVRVDGGVRSGDRISPDYDPMIAKIIAHGPDRPTALRRLAAALAATEVAGVQTNLTLLHRLTTHADFTRGGVDTGFIGREAAELLAVPAVPDEAIAAACLAVLAERAATGNGDPWSAADGFRLNAPAHLRVDLRIGMRDITVAATPQTTGWRLGWDGATHSAALDATLRLDDRVSPVSVLMQADAVTIFVGAERFSFDRVDPLAPPASAATAGGRIVSPIPGRVVAVLVVAGEAVSAGQKLVVLEAMKMELSLTAPAAGVVAEVRCAVGERVEEGVELIILAAADDPTESAKGHSP